LEQVLQLEMQRFSDLTLKNTKSNSKLSIKYYTIKWLIDKKVKGWGNIYYRKRERKEGGKEGRREGRKEGREGGRKEGIAGWVVKISEIWFREMNSTKCNISYS
jgi:hypothetical protein